MVVVVEEEEEMEEDQEMRQNVLESDRPRERGREGDPRPLAYDPRPPVSVRP